MSFFDSAGVKIHYHDIGSGEPVVLVHGFASTAEHNWGGTGWISALSAKYRVIALDVRGHGLSDKPHEREAYGYASMGADVTRLMDHLGIARAPLIGYSMGASIAIELMLTRPGRFRAIVLGGIAYDDGLEDQADRDAISEAYRADDIPKPLPGFGAILGRQLTDLPTEDIRDFLRINLQPPAGGLGPDAVPEGVHRPDKGRRLHSGG